MVCQYYLAVLSLTLFLFFFSLSFSLSVSVVPIFHHLLCAVRLTSKYLSTERMKTSLHLMCVDYVCQWGRLKVIICGLWLNKMCVHFTYSRTLCHTMLKCMQSIVLSLVSFVVVLFSVFTSFSISSSLSCVCVFSVKHFYCPWKEKEHFLFNYFKC